MNGVLYYIGCFGRIYNLKNKFSKVQHEKKFRIQIIQQQRAHFQEFKQANNNENSINS